MKYDIFISYSRKDIEFTRKVCAVLDGYKQYYDFEYFFDQSEITSRDEYLKRISSAILESRVVLFLASKNSYDSEFCAKELLFADKKGRHIHQYLLDEAEMPLDIEILLGTHQYREFKTTPMESVVYKVGDFYNDGTKKGVVFEASEDGKHGKIVSIYEAHLPWCTRKQCDKDIQVGANSDRDGKTNTDVVMQRSDYAEYPAFKWCREQGEEWYLPSEEELLALYDVKDLVNKTLAQYYYKQIQNNSYWSSTEKDEFCVWDVYMFNGYSDDFDKYYFNYVRAVSAF